MELDTQNVKRSSGLTCGRRRMLTEHRAFDLRNVDEVFQSMMLIGTEDGCGEEVRTRTEHRGDVHDLQVSVWRTFSFGPVVLVWLKIKQVDRLYELFSSRYAFVAGAGNSPSGSLIGYTVRPPTYGP